MDGRQRPVYQGDFPVAEADQFLPDDIGIHPGPVLGRLVDLQSSRFVDAVEISKAKLLNGVINRVATIATEGLPGIILIDPGVGTGLPAMAAGDLFAQGFGDLKRHESEKRAKRGHPP